MKLKNKAIAMMLALTTIVFTGVSSNAITIQQIQQIKGSDRYSTASSIAGEMGSYDSVILVNADNNKLSDGLSASGLSGVLKAPILLVSKNSIPNETQLRLEIAKNIYIIGSENSISSSLEQKLKDSEKGGFSVTRIGGRDRFETSSNVAKMILSIKGSVGKAFVANGYKGDADAMSISSVAARDGEPVLLTDGTRIDATTSKILESTSKVYAIGGTNSISTSLIRSIGANRLSGNDRFETNAQVINAFYSEKPQQYFLSDGYKLVDALTGGPLAGKSLSPIVLVNGYSNKSVLSGAQRMISLGGISTSVLNACVAAANK
ncbi:MAG: cell wall-binding repeat-containing protein [Peptostreptococcus porci]|uniref:Cell wall-binding repeat-containing protein n=3 Tax=Peptostreptococcus porci TaxID=2652282 RepID=A0A6N7X0Y2_9FIRM|nr:cell wall-binding repeat-containing protein [Peptostreptococcus porci]MDD7183474.1 cell wall-binding repeat-containing protein [Peptostreptococcus porci]MDY2795172.1 cell wall-binding repeat-containing protein [Peptostreptococcus porci]MDY4127433.1 cell wall-binding repeat-containing protein [Peptostreptococcus porci]MDY5479423.1 cell wall-binding repeat-containing protein [Peptostreptococcus porci]MDY5964427.1 cell wall-binding repeat-containing protein [Peptostreptococcus porci]